MNYFLENKLASGWSKQAMTAGKSLAAISLIFTLSSCNTPTNAVESAKIEAQQKADEEAAAKASNDNVIHQSSTVSRKGTNIRAIVNGIPITNYDVQRRIAFLKLRRVSGNRSQKALDEMVEQSIKLEEAALRGTLASDDQVNQAFANFAKSNRMSSKQLSSVLSKSGVSSVHFKDYIKTQISWSRTIQSKFKSDTERKTTADTIFELRKSGGEKPTANEYVLEQTIFVVPQGKSKAYINQRRAEALAFRSSFTKCGETTERAVGLRDVTVRKLPRTLEIQLPAEWKDEISKLDEGDVTGVKNTDKGVEFIAICSKKLVSDDNVAKITNQQSEFDKFNASANTVGDEYFQELKSKARIIYR